MTGAAPPRLHVVTDDDVLGRPDFVESAAAILRDGGARVALHLRGPRTEGATLHGLAAVLAREARASGGRLFVNDRLDVAMAVGADGVHLGTRSLPVGVVRRLTGDALDVGVSVHAPGELSACRAEGANFAFLGTVFETPSHPGRIGTGLAGFRAAASVTAGWPVLGIGGIDVGRAAELVEAGAWGVAVVRGVWARPDPVAGAREYLTAIGRAMRAAVEVG